MSAYWYMFGDQPDHSEMVGTIAIDTETTGLRWTDNILGLSLAWRTASGDLKSCYFSNQASLFYDDIWPGQKLDEFVVITLIDQTVVGHYISFDARVLFKAFGMVPMKSYDTWHMAKSTRFSDSYSLDNVAGSFGIADADWSAQKKTRGGLAHQSPQSVADYARKDAVYTLMVYERLINDYRALGIEETDLAFSRLTYEMMARGFPLNEELLEQRLATETKTFSDFQIKLAGQGITNVNSPAKVVDALHKQGILVVNASAEALAPWADREIVADVIAASQLQSNINSRLSVFKEYAYKGRLHSEWHPFGTASYRMVAKDPNLMAQPLKDRDGRAYDNLSELFTTDTQYCLQLDIAQAEVRLAAMIAKCNSMAELLSSGQDAYMDMAKKAYGAATKKNRQKAKRATLASIYEEGPMAFSEKHKVPMDEAVVILDQFKASFPEIKLMSRQYMEYAKSYGYINLYTGRRVYFDKADPRLYRAFNQEVQGGLAELMRHFMLRMDQQFPGALIGQIHDSLILNFDRRTTTRADIEQVKETSLLILQDCLPPKVYNLTRPAIPLKLDFEPLKPAYDEEF